MTERLREKVCLVTGATGIGAASARLFASEGAEVFVVSISEEDCEALVEVIERDGGTAAYAQADLTDEAQAESAFDACVNRFGRIDAALAVVGGSGRRFGDGPLDEVHREAWDSTMALNATTAMLTMREAVRAMRASGVGGSVVVVTSVLADRPAPELFATHAYAAAKGAIRSLVTTAAARYAREGIRINAIAPGVTTSPMSARAAADPKTSSYVERKQPLSGGFLPPEDVGAAALYLLSNESRYVTGQILAVDGGWSVVEA